MTHDEIRKLLSEYQNRLKSIKRQVGSIEITFTYKDYEFYASCPRIIRQLLDEVDELKKQICLSKEVERIQSIIIADHQFEKAEEIKARLKKERLKQEQIKLLENILEKVKNAYDTTYYTIPPTMETYRKLMIDIINAKIKEIKNGND